MLVTRLIEKLNTLPDNTWIFTGSLDEARLVDDVEAGLIDNDGDPAALLVNLARGNTFTLRRKSSNARDVLLAAGWTEAEIREVLR